MSVEIKDLQTQEIIKLDVSVAQIHYALQWIVKEKARQKGKYQRYHMATGNPIGRPRKNPPVTDLTKSGAVELKD